MEIKFKALDEENNWVYGYYVERFNPETNKIISGIYEENILPTDDSERKSYFTKFTPIKRETLCQYIGLKDKNGDPIYQGDIIKREYFPIGSNPEVIEYYIIGIVVYDYSGFYVKPTREGTYIRDVSRALSHQVTKEEDYYHTTEGKDYISKINNFSKYIIIGNIHKQ